MRSWRTKVRRTGQRISLGRNEARKKVWEFLWACEAEEMEWSSDYICLGAGGSAYGRWSFGGEDDGTLGNSREQETVLQKRALAYLPARAGKLAKLAKLAKLVGWVRRRGQRGYNELSVLRVVSLVFLARDAYSHVHGLQSRFKPFIPTSAVAGAKNYAELRMILRYSAIAVIAGVLPKGNSPRCPLRENLTQTRPATDLQPVLLHLRRSNGRYLLWNTCGLPNKIVALGTLGNNAPGKIPRAPSAVRTERFIPPTFCSNIG